MLPAGGWLLAGGWRPLELGAELGWLGEGRDGDPDGWLDGEGMDEGDGMLLGGVGMLGGDEV